MLSPHETLASDSYWAGTIAPAQERVSLAAQVVDLFAAPGTPQVIDEVYRDIASRGMVVTPVQQGEPH